MKDLFKIGEVSNICNISIKTLRYYEEFGLIKPKEIDIYTGYRYYDINNIDKIYKIQFLKSLGMSLKDINNVSREMLDKYSNELSQEIKNIQNKLFIISSLKNQKGEINMKPFIEDLEVIGRWKYNCSTLSKEDYLNQNYYEDKDVLLKNLYFLPKGEGYWIFDRWTKGELYHFRGEIYKYSLDKDKLFLEVYDENNDFEVILVYDRVDNIEYTKEDIEIKDDIDLPFELDNNLLGVWTAVDYISIKDKYNYKPKLCEKELFLKSLALMDNGECFKEFKDNRIVKIKWTKDYIIDTKNVVNCNYVISNIDNKTYLIMDWKSGDYIYGGIIQGCYVFVKE